MFLYTLTIQKRSNEFNPSTEWRHEMKMNKFQYDFVSEMINMDKGQTVTRSILRITVFLSHSTYTSNGYSSH